MQIKRILGCIAALGLFGQSVSAESVWKSNHSWVDVPDTFETDAVRDDIRSKQKLLQYTIDRDLGYWHLLSRLGELSEDVREMKCEDPLAYGKHLDTLNLITLGMIGVGDILPHMQKKGRTLHLQHRSPRRPAKYGIGAPQAIDDSREGQKHYKQLEKSEQILRQCTEDNPEFAEAVMQALYSGYAARLAHHLQGALAIIQVTRANHVEQQYKQPAEFIQDHLPQNFPQIETPRRDVHFYDPLKTEAILKRADFSTEAYYAHLVEENQNTKSESLQTSRTILKHVLDDYNVTKTDERSLIALLDAMPSRNVWSVFEASKSAIREDQSLFEILQEMGQLAIKLDIFVGSDLTSAQRAELLKRVYIRWEEKIDTIDESDLKHLINYEKARFSEDFHFKDSGLDKSLNGVDDDRVLNVLRTLNLEDLNNIRHPQGLYADVTHNPYTKEGAELLETLSLVQDFYGLHTPHASWYQHMDHIEGMPSRLTLDDTYLGKRNSATEMETLAQHFPNCVKTLIVRRLSDSAWETLIESLPQSKVEDLQLRWSNLTKEKFAQVLKILPDTDITTLDMSDAPILKNCRGLLDLVDSGSLSKNALQKVTNLGLKGLKINMDFSEDMANCLDILCDGDVRKKLDLNRLTLGREGADQLLADTLQKAKRLTHLSLQLRLYAFAHQDRCLRVLQALPLSLEDLSLNSFFVPYEEDQIGDSFQALARLENLTSLRFGYGTVYESRAAGKTKIWNKKVHSRRLFQELKELSALKKLEILSIDTGILGENCYLSFETAKEALEPIAQCTNLRKIYLDRKIEYKSDVNHENNTYLCVDEIFAESNDAFCFRRQFYKGHYAPDRTNRLRDLLEGYDIY